jgi:hypothetical protein
MQGPGRIASTSGAPLQGAAGGEQGFRMACDPPAERLFALKIIRNKYLAADRHLSHQNFSLAELKCETTSIIERS